MAVVLRYVDEHGCVIERFIGVEHIVNTTALSLKYAIDKLLSRYAKNLVGEALYKESLMVLKLLF